MISPRKLNYSENKKKELFSQIVSYCEMNLEHDKLILNVAQRYRRTDKNGSHVYNYQIMGMYNGKIYDITWQVAGCLNLKYDSKISTIIHNNYAYNIIDGLNNFNKKYNLNFKDFEINDIV